MNFSVLSIAIKITLRINCCYATWAIWANKSLYKSENKIDMSNITYEI